ncbi:hypothetical protein FGO68_gene14118 [Halteria grandinella]|uniref:Uncharacterized protein n=1 Tax=Halteria grandinella TaxID=5974 RepID=A0A8J8T5P9_HALGN|nr:hypothetical protein FGO68_gene14118 [Halteria grandinella]
MSEKFLNEFLNQMPNPSKQLHFNDFQNIDLYSKFFVEQAKILNDRNEECQYDTSTKRIKLKFDQNLESLLIPSLNYILAKCINLENLNISFAEKLFDKEAVLKEKEKCRNLNIEGKCFNFKHSKLKQLKIKILSMISNHGYRYKNFIPEYSDICQAICHLCKCSKQTLHTLKMHPSQRESSFKEFLLQNFFCNLLNNMSDAQNRNLQKLEFSHQLTSFENLKLLSERYTSIKVLKIDEPIGVYPLSIYDLILIFRMPSLEKLTLNLQYTLQNQGLLLDYWEVFSQTSNKLGYLQINCPSRPGILSYIAFNKRPEGFIFVNTNNQRWSPPRNKEKAEELEEAIIQYPHISFDLRDFENYSTIESLLEGVEV